MNNNFAVDEKLSSLAIDQPELDTFMVTSFCIFSKFDNHCMYIEAYKSATDAISFFFFELIPYCLFLVYYSLPYHNYTY